MRKSVKKDTPISAQSQEAQYRDRYRCPDAIHVRPDYEYWDDVQGYGVKMLESTSYEERCKLIMLTIQQALKAAPEKLLRELLEAMSSEEFSMEDFCWDFAKNHVVDLLCVPGKKANAARMR